MKNIILIRTMNIPHDIVDEILSYGDVNVTQKYNNIVRQINYLSNEFNYQRKKNRTSIWYNKSKHSIMYFINMKNRQKQAINNIKSNIRTNPLTRASYQESYSENIVSYIVRPRIIIS